MILVAVGLLPSWRTVKVDPVRALHTE